MMRLRTFAALGAAFILSACKDSPSGPTTGSLNVTIGGLPAGLSGVVTITGPSSYTKTVTAGQMIAGLSPGSYTVAAANVTDASGTYAASPASQAITIAASNTPIPVTASYALITGSMTITVNGVPAGGTAAITITGPGGFSQNLTSGTLVGLVPGQYTVNAASVTVSAGTWSATVPTQLLTVNAGATATTGTVDYALASGGLTVTVNGVPSGATGSVTVTGPAGFSQPLTITQTFVNLTPGTYTIAGASIPSSGQTYAPAPASQQVVIAASLTPSTATVTYAIATGSLTLGITGLPGGVSGNVAITGPGGFSQTLTAPTTIGNLTPGNYVLTANNIVSGPSIYGGAPPTQTKAVTAGGTASATVTYSVVATATLNLTIAGMYVVQSTQAFAGDVPLVKDRGGLLRVFVKANLANTVTPQVRVRFYNGATLLQTNTISAPTAAVPTAIDESTLAGSWNLSLPVTLVQPGISVLADVDPTNTILEANETDNQFPATGPLALDVRDMPRFDITFVPVLITADGTQGNVSGANVNQFMNLTSKMWPIMRTDIAVYPTYTTAAPALMSNDANGAWNQILSEVRALEIMDGRGRYFYGVVHTTYTRGIAGLGYVGAGAAIGWDDPSGDGVAAHELGHNFGRLHAPCGNPSGVDPNYPTYPPYTNAAIGVTGLDFATLTIKQASQFDLMSYCHPEWISDYTFKAALDWRSSHGDITQASNASAQRTLLVWGRITNDEVVLEPSFTIVTRPTLPSRPGPYRVDALDASGASLFSLSFAGEEVADGADGARQFAFTVPMSADVESRLAELRLSAPGRPTRSLRSNFAITAQGPIAPDPRPVVSSIAGGRARVQWNAATHPMVMVRDARSGQVLSLGRDGTTTVSNNGGDLELVFSDRVRSITQRVSVPR